MARAGPRCGGACGTRQRGTQQRREGRFRGCSMHPQPVLEDGLLVGTVLGSCSATLGRRRSLGLSRAESTVMAAGATEGEGTFYQGCMRGAVIE